MLRILHTNDFHGSLNAAREAKLMEIRRSCDVYFDCGDAVKSGNLAIPFRPEEAWGRLANLECTASVPGNRESHVLTAGFAKKIEGHGHPILCANLRLRNGERPLPAHLIVRAAGLVVGIVGVMVPMVTKRMATQAASAYLWDPPVASAISEGEALRPTVDCLIALTHIGLRQDRELATKTSAFDMILGGHSHDVIAEPLVVGRTTIGQAGSHGRFAARYEWSPDHGMTAFELVGLT